LVLVAAVADNGVIGRAGRLPWRLASDLKRFRQITTGHPVVMGRRTYQSIGRPLKDRTIIVVSRSPEFAAAGVVAVTSIEAALAVASADALRRGVAAIVIAGGAEIYQATIERAARLELTRVHANPEGETMFPPVDWEQWRLGARMEFPAGPGDEVPFDISTYDRVGQTP
jgi:dihydrofolate reductase